MAVHVEETDGMTVVALEGDLDANSASVTQQEILPLAHGGVRMVLDMSKVPYMSSAGVRMLLATYRQVNASGGQIALVGIADDVKDTMSVTGFLKFFQVYDTLEDCRRAIAG